MMMVRQFVNVIINIILNLECSITCNTCSGVSTFCLTCNPSRYLQNN